MARAAAPAGEKRLRTARTRGDAKGNGAKTNGADGNGHDLQLGPKFRPASFFAAPPQSPTAAVPAHQPPVPIAEPSSSSAIASTAAPAEAHLIPLPSAPADDSAILQDRVDQLIRAYRVRGHTVANVDPLARPRPQLPELDPRTYHFTEADLDRTFSTDTIEGPQMMTLRRIVDRMRNTYCRSIGVQFMHMDDMAVRHWLQVRMEGSRKPIDAEPPRAVPHFDASDECGRVRRVHPKEILRREELLARRCRNADSAFGNGDRASRRTAGRRSRVGDGSSRTVERVGQHHGQKPAPNLPRVCGYRPRATYRPRRREISSGPQHRLGHLGRPKVHLSLCFNPSHLEFVDPVAIGRVRAKQDRVDDLQRPPRLVPAHSRRCRLRRRRNHSGDVKSQPVAGLQNRRHVPRRCEQPDRLHHQPSEGRSRPTPPTWPRCCRSPSSTSTAKIRKPWRRWFAWGWISAANSNAMS